MAFAGTNRFVVQRELGEGGMGTVYQALDLEQGSTVALKVLLRENAVSRLKQEFRTLADVSHPNLVGYHELVESGGRWFFTMELVDGVDLLEWVRSGRGERSISTSPASPWAMGASASRATAASAASRPTEMATPSGSRDLETMALASPSEPTSAADVWGVAQAGGDLGFDPARVLAWWGHSGPKPTVQCDLGRLRTAIEQLSHGLVALHEANLLHRDVKPSNVMVTNDGRVVLLDFGLAGEDTSDEEHSGTIQGTPPYMAPELLRSEASAAADWYAVGVILFEALTGMVPFIGAPREVLLAKQILEPPRPSDLVDGVDPDLDALCADLLKKDPDARPNGHQVLERVGARSTWKLGPKRSLPFVGREEHVRSLASAFAATRSGHAVTVYVQGRSGMGKSALIRRFLEDLRHGGALVLSGRCYERESVPYKAVDTLIDALARVLERRDVAAVRPLLPPHLRALVRLFPVLGEVKAVADACAGDTSGDVPDPLELRRLGFGALRELLGRLARQVPLVLYIDDLQWGDLDSAALLADLLRPPSPPPLLLISSFRTEEIESSQVLRELTSPASPFRKDLDARDLVVGPLDEATARRLALDFLPKDAQGRETVARAIAEEAGGSPYFLAELLRWWDAASSGGEDRALPRLEDVLAARIARLPDEAKRLLEVVAVGGRPLPQRIVLAASELAQGSLGVGLLRTERFVRTRGHRASDEVEAYHDRVREGVLASLSPERTRACHLSIGLVLEREPSTDPELLATHFRGGGDSPRALRYLLQAADKSARALAFDHAAGLYGEALELLPTAGPDTTRALRARADALVSGGRGAEAWRVYAQGAQASGDRREIADLERLAADSACCSGHVDQGMELFRSATAAVGMPMSTSNLKALGSLLSRRAWFRVRGLKYTPRHERDVPADLLARLDAAMSVSSGVGMVDPIQGADYQVRSVLFALEAGEPGRLAKALAAEVCYLSTEGYDSLADTTAVLRVAEEVAARADTPDALPRVDLARAFLENFLGKWGPSLEHARRAEAAFRERCVGVEYERHTAQVFEVFILLMMGRLRELCEVFPGQIRAAAERGNTYGVTTKQTLAGHMPHLVGGDPRAARAAVDEAVAAWSKRAFYLQHWYALQSLSEIDFYEGEAEQAWKRGQADFFAMQRSMLLRVVNIRVNFHSVRARAAVAVAGRRKGRLERALLLAEAARCERAIAATRIPEQQGWAWMSRAARSWVAGKPDAAVAALEQAVSVNASAEMRALEAIARRRLGIIVGGDRGRELVREGEGYLRAEGVADVARFSETYLPGFES